MASLYIFLQIKVEYKYNIWIYTYFNIPWIQSLYLLVSLL